MDLRDEHQGGWSLGQIQAEHRFGTSLSQVLSWTGNNSSEVFDTSCVLFLKAIISEPVEERRIASRSKLVL